MPPLVPATVNAGVVVGLATEIKPPVKPTLVTVPEPPPATAVSLHTGTPPDERKPCCAPPIGNLTILPKAFL